LKLKAVLAKSEADILNALKKDLGKCDFEAYTTEVALVINDIDYMIKNIKRLSKPKKVKTPLMYIGGSSYVIPEPFGVVLIIGPWNYPFQLVMSPLVGAIAAGNCAVIKPSEFSPHISKVISKLIKETFSQNYIAVVEGGIETSQLLLEQKFDYIFFTGGTGIGKIVMAAAAKNLTPVTLELGGKSPCIVNYNANLKYAAKRIVWGKFLNAGQTCVAPDYLLVHKKIKEELLKNVIETVKEFYGDEPSISNFYSKIINERHFDRLISLLDEGKVLVGGKHNRENLYIAPTVVDPTSIQSKIMQEEIFGPILPVIEYEELNEAISFVNARPKPLALYFFSNDRKSMDRVIKETSSGGVCINDTISHITTPYLPFGGVGDSGMGNYHGSSSFDTFSHKKSVLRNQMTFDIKIKYPPYNISLNIIKKIMKLFLS
jgi:aldehyde dehydrogenase (NAD+)